MAQHRYKAALFYFKVYAVKDLFILTGIGESYILKTNNRTQGNFLSDYRSQRQVAPQGRYRPLSVTGRPSSWLSLRPPNFLEKMLSVT